MRLIRIAALGLSMILSASAEPPVSGGIDVHMHLDARMARSPEARRGPRTATRDFIPAADNLVALMDRYGVEKALVMPPPESPGQDGAYSYEELLAAIRRHPTRLFLAAGGDALNILIIGTDSAAVTPSVRAKFLSEAERVVRDGAKAFGEMSALHFSFSARHSFKQAPPDHPLFLMLADIAAEHQMPIDLHIEATESEEPVSPKLLSRSSANPATVAATIPGLERLLRHNRMANVVWQHGGWDNTGRATPALFRRLFDAHRNLFVALKVVKANLEPFRSQNSLCDADGKINPAWRELIIDFPERFVIGADEFILPSEGSMRKGPPSFEDTWAILDQLPEDVRKRVSRENAARLYKL